MTRTTRMAHNTSMDPAERRHADDRRGAPRGGRRPLDVPGRYPPVLVADSDDGARRVCARYLGRFGFQVEEATTGEAAVAIVEMCHPQVAIAELTLPRDDDFQARVRERDIPYIVTVASDVGCTPPDAAAVLLKPFPLSSLISAVRLALSAGQRR